MTVTAPNRSGTPAPGQLVKHHALSGALAADAVLSTGVGAASYVSIPDAGAWRFRGLFTVGGTLSFAYHRPPPTAETAYTDATPDDVAVTANTPFTTTIFPQGECFVVVTYTPSGNGTVTYLDVMHAAAPIPYRSTGGRMEVINYLWDPNTLAYVVAQTTNGTGADVTVTNTVPVTGPLTDAQLRASAVPVTMGVVGLSPASPTAVVVGVASAIVVASNASRKGLKLRNLSTSSQRISLAYGTPAVLDTGDTLYAQDVYAMSQYDFTTGDVRAIASAAGAVLAIQELS